MEISHTVIAFRPISNVRLHRVTNMQMCKPTAPQNSVQRRIKSAIAAVVIAASTMDTSFAFADTPAVPMTRSALEQSIQKLEASNTRSEVIQSLADVFEAAGTKTLLVRTKYKYVSPQKQVNKSCHNKYMEHCSTDHQAHHLLSSLSLAHCNRYQ